MTASPDPRLFVVGSLNVDSMIRVGRHPAPGETVQGGDPQSTWGGKGANQAVAAARVGGAGRVVFVGRVGDDPAGREYRARLAAVGIDVGHLLVTVGASTGSAVIAVGPTGENAIIVSPGANALLSPADLAVLDDLTAQDAVVTSLELPLVVVQHAATRARRVGARLVLNLSPVGRVPADIARQADPLIVNEHEAVEVVATLGELPSMLVTRGAEGSDWSGVHAPACEVSEVRDTTGAGDAYCGALAAALIQGADAQSAMRVAAMVAAEVVTRIGAQ